jgi:predicted Zn-dependent protease
LFIAIALSNAQAETTNRWAAIFKSFQQEVLAKARTNYPQFFPEVPLVKRTQFNLFSTEQENNVGDHIWMQTATNSIPPDLAKAQERLTNIAFRLVAAANTLSNIPRCSFEFRMVANSNFNAFCCPGGKIGVNSGVLPIVRDDDEFSFVIAHEIGHALARHGGETMTREVLRQKALTGANFIADWAEHQKHLQKESVTNLMRGLDKATLLTMILPHKREQEVEADHIGLIVMSKAGFRPQAAIDLWERMAALQSNTNSPVVSKIAEYCRTHPPDAERVANLKLWLPEVANK